MLGHAGWPNDGVKVNSRGKKSWKRYAGRIENAQEFAHVDKKSIAVRDVKLSWDASIMQLTKSGNFHKDMNTLLGKGIGVLIFRREVRRQFASRVELFNN